MADLKDKQIRLVGSQSFAYATGSSYTQGHVHFTTDEHGSIVVNGKVYGTTDASYVYVGSKNIPTYVDDAIDDVLKRSYAYTDGALKLSYAYTDARINALGGKASGSGKFVYHVDQTNGIVTTHKNTLQYLVTVDNSEAKAYAPKAVNENVKFIKAFEIEGDTIIPKYDYFANNLPTIPSINVADTKYSGCYLPEFSASGHTITVTNGTEVTNYEDFKDLKAVVDRFFGGADLDTEAVKSYIDTLAEIQEAFKNSYAESIANSIKDITISQSDSTLSTYINLTYTTHGGTVETVKASIPYATNSVYGLVKYDNSTIVKNSNNQLSLSTIHTASINITGENANQDKTIIVGNANGNYTQVIIPTLEYNSYGLITKSYNAYLRLGYASGTAMGLVKYDNSTIKMNSNNQLYVDGELTDTKYSMNAIGSSTAAQIALIGTDNTRDNIAFRGTGIATVSYNSTNKAIEINVPETVINYNHHSTNAGVNIGTDIILDSAGQRNAYKFISEVKLSTDGKLSYSYVTIKHESIFSGNNYVGTQTNTLSQGSIVVPKLTFNACGHLTAYENVLISGIAAEDHSHDEFVWL